MVRPTQLLHPQREPAPVRPAATVLLLRDTPQGIEVLMTRRSMTASFAPGAYVFPGGGVDALDAAAHAQASRRETQSDLHLTQAIAAIRESFEELGILLARREDGTMANANDIAALDRKAPFAPQCAARGLSLAASEVFVLAHWITDRDLPRRFDVPFLVARMPEGQAPVADETEQFEPVWVRPLDALARHRAGQFFIIFPTIRTLERLQDFASVEAVLQACAATEQPLWTSCPRAGLLAGKEARYMEHETAYGELAMVCPDGQIVHALDWQSEQPTPPAAQRDAPDRTQPRRDDRPWHQQLPGRRPAHWLHRDRPGPGRRRAHRPALARGRRADPHDRVHPFAPRPFARRASVAGPVRARAHRSWACLPPPRRARPASSRPTAPCTTWSGWCLTPGCPAARAITPFRCCTHRDTPPTTCAWSCWRTACSSAATTSSTAARP
jgi:8-oxo-dGTP pyrophosphatase MutT (NUDIX family)